MDDIVGFLDIERSAGVLHANLSVVVWVLEWVVALVSLLAVVVMLTGVARFVVGVLWAELRRDNAQRVQRLNQERMGLGRYILSGLELLIVSDIIHTALSLDLGNLLFLGLLVLIRAVIGFFLDREIREIRAELGADTT
jgi:uncharacterized membrane protein